MQHKSVLGRKWVGLLAGLMVTASGMVLAQVDTMASIKQKGKMVVGVKADYKPFGYTDPSGKIVGLEIDLANDLAKRMGVQIELVPVVAANRMEFVKQGRTDLMIATMAYKPDRAEVVGIPQPFYYAGAATILAKKRRDSRTGLTSKASLFVRFKAHITTEKPAKSLALSWWFSKG